MAQVIKLKRTAVQGKIPTTSNLELGELALNTYDGRIFFEKNDGTPSIQEILTTNTTNSGSLNLDGAVTASSLNITGNTTIGGDLTLEGQLTIGDATTDSVNVIASLSSSLIPNNNLSFDIGSTSRKWNNSYIGTSNVDVQNIIDTRSGQNYSLTIGANSTGDRFHVATDNTANAGIILSSRNAGNTTDQKLSFSGSAFEFGGGTVSGTFSGDGSGLTGLAVDQVATVTSSFDNSSTINVSHNFDTYNVIVSTYDTNYNQLIPQTVSLTDTNTVQVVLSAAHSGHVVVAKGGHVVSGSTAADNISGFDTKVKTKLNAENVISSSAQLADDFLEQFGEGTVSGSSQIDHDQTTNFVANEHIDHSTITLGSGKGLTGGGTIDVSRSLTLHTGSAHFVDGVVGATSYREDVSGASFYTITHSLDESYPFVQAWNTSNNTMEIPIDVETTSANVITISFSANFAGKIIVKK